jgi:hypothetical protein
MLKILDELVQQYLWCIVITFHKNWNEFDMEDLKTLSKTM